MVDFKRHQIEQVCTNPVTPDSLASKTGYADEFADDSTVARNSPRDHGDLSWESPDPLGHSYYPQRDRLLNWRVFDPRGLLSVAAATQAGPPPEPAE